MIGTITRVFLPNGYAFIQGEDGLDYFFQAQELHIGSWDGVTVRKGAHVSFIPKNDGTKGNKLRATEVRIL